MKRILLYVIVFIGSTWCNLLFAQTRNLSFYIDKASLTSPFILDMNNQMKINDDEQERLKAQYTHSRLEVDGSYLFVPIINRDNGTNSFQWDAKDAKNYYGYNSSVTSGEARAGVAWIKPLTGAASYNIAKQKIGIDKERFGEKIRLEQHELNRLVTEQYLLCQSDLIALAQTDSINEILRNQRNIIEKLARQALAKQTDINLLDIEISNNSQIASSLRQSYWNHLLDMNLLCGIIDTTNVKLEPVHLQQNITNIGSQFLHSYMLDSISIKSDYDIYSIQYKPQVNLFVDGGMRTTSTFTNFANHFGTSAGVTFSWLINDGGQKKRKYHQMQYLLETNEGYKNQKMVEVIQKRNECRKQLIEQQFQVDEVQKQLSYYENLLRNYQREIAVGQLSVIDYITILKSYIKQKKDYNSLIINRELIINALNYWNW